MTRHTDYAVGFDLRDGKGIICCFCYKNILLNHAMPELLIAITRPVHLVRGSELCPKCNLPYRRGQTEEAAKTIQKTWLF